MAAKADGRKQKEVSGSFVKKNISLKLMNKKEGNSNDLNYFSRQGLGHVYPTPGTE